MTMTTDMARWGWALLSVVLYLGLCAWVYGRHHRRQRALAKQQGSLVSGVPGAEGLSVVAYASQTGQAEALAWQTAETLHLGGQPVRVIPLNELDEATLAERPTLYLILSTYGEGDPPDNGTVWAERVAQDTLRIPNGLSYAVLALGDRSYQHFCGFGRLVDDCLQGHGAHPMFARIEVDQMAEPALQSWFEQVGHQAGVDHVTPWADAPFDEDGWVLTDRRWLNAGSPGEAVYHLVLTPQPGRACTWQAGDLVQVRPPGASQARDYSIAAIAEEGALALLVRIRRTDDGQMGLASGWLCHTAPLGTAVPLRLRTHANFRIGDNAARPLILIGNGTGMAGLRAHLQARARQWAQAAGQGAVAPCWLLFGERAPEVDLHHRDDLRAWQEQGVLARLDAVYSRSDSGPRYVQERLAQCADTLRDWVAQGAALYVCGSLAGMAAGVDATLREVLGDEALQTLAREGRYRRDVY